jgi:p-aminobenzoyl-glutamate transporter AbgT
MPAAFWSARAGISESEKQGSLSGFLGTIERVGNAVPHPAIIFLILIAIVIVLSAIFGMLGTSVTYEGYDAAGRHRHAGRLRCAAFFRPTASASC